MASEKVIPIGRARAEDGAGDGDRARGCGHCGGALEVAPCSTPECAGQVAVCFCVAAINEMFAEGGTCLACRHRAFEGRVRMYVADRLQRAAEVASYDELVSLGECANEILLARGDTAGTALTHRTTVFEDLFEDAKRLTDPSPAREMAGETFFGRVLTSAAVLVPDVRPLLDRASEARARASFLEWLRTEGTLRPMSILLRALGSIGLPGAESANAVAFLRRRMGRGSM